MAGFFSALPLSLADTSISSWSVWTLIASIAFPAITALAVFVFLRGAPASRKLLCYFISLPVFLAPSLFLFASPGGPYYPLIGEQASMIPQVCGFLTCMALGTAYLALNVIICSAGVMKLAGRTACAVLSMFFFFSQTLLLLRSLELQGPRIAMKEVFPATGGLPASLSYFAECSPDALSVMLAALFLISVFLCFFANLSRAELAEAGRRRESDLERLEAGRRTSPDASRCSLCVHASELHTDRSKVLCDKRGPVPGLWVCPKFEYDPLKRPVPGKDSGGEQKKE